MVLPRTVEEVQHVMRTATALRVPVVPQGARTGLSGAANASDGCIVLSLTRMDRILEINPVDRVTVSRTGRRQRHALPRGERTRPVLPARPLQLGDVHHRRQHRYHLRRPVLRQVRGATAEYVLGLDVVLADGRLMSTGRRTAKGVAGYGLTRLFVGSEGSLGIVVRAVLALRPKPPEQLVLAAEFASATAACDAICRSWRAGTCRPSSN